MSDNGYETKQDQTLEEAGNPAQETAELAGKGIKKSAKKVGKAIENESKKETAKTAVAAGKAIAQGIGALAATPAGIVILVIAGILIVVWLYITEFSTPLEQVRDALTPEKRFFWQKDEDEMGGLDPAWDGTTGAGNFEDAINEYNGKSAPPTDANHTALFIQKLKKVFGQGDKETSDHPEDIGTVREDNWSQLMTKEISYFTQENLIHIIQECADYNNDMFRYFEQFYEYKQWRLKEYYRDGILVGVKWVKTFPVVGTTGDGLFDKLSKIHIEGEKDGEEYKFQVHWQDVLAAAHIMSMNKESDEVDPDDIVRDKTTFFKTKTINPETYLKYQELKQVYDLFAYKFDYYYGTTEDLEKHNTAQYDVRYEYDRKRDLYHKDGPTLREGDYQLAYRYKRIADPVDDEDDHGADYSSSDEAPSGPAPYTKFVPDRAPNLISNSYDAYKYVYISTDDVPDYTPDPDKYEPPKGLYCIGRWHIQNPKPFIEAMDALNPYWHDQALGEHGAVRVKAGYNWVENMMDEYCEYLEILPWVGEESHTQSRIDFFQNLSQMYQDKKIIVSYEGTTYDGMDEFITTLQEQYPGWHIVWEKDYVGEFGEALTKKGKSSTGSESVGGIVGATGENRPLTDEEIKNVSQDVLNVAKTIYGEARGESYEGKIAVAQVIKNRMMRDGVSATEIVSKPHQFDGYQNYKNRSAESLPGIDELINIAYNVLNGNLRVFEYDDVVGFRSGERPETHGGGTYYMDIGGHHFYSTTPHTPQASTTAVATDGYSEMVKGGEGDSVLTGSFYPAFADPSTYPFWSYGVTFHPTSHFDDDGFIHLTDQEFDKLDHWAMTYEELRLLDDSELKPTELDGLLMLAENWRDLFYMNQADPAWASILRGDCNETIRQSGCLDSTVAMIVSWMTGTKVPVTAISQYVGANEQLQTATVLSKYGLQQSENKRWNPDGIKAELKEGRMPIVHIYGSWTASDGTVLHSNNNGHFLTIYGYDDTGFYVADPGKRANNHINYEDWTVSQLYYRTVTKK